MFVLFDDCWYGDARPGPQPDPVPGFHNSYWLQCPRYSEVMDPTRWGALEPELLHRDILRGSRALGHAAAPYPRPSPGPPQEAAAQARIRPIRG